MLHKDLHLVSRHERNKSNTQHNLMSGNNPSQIPQDYNSRMNAHYEMANIES